MRLLDRILSYGFDSRTMHDKGPFAETLRKSQLVVIDNVADYYASQVTTGNNSVQVSDFPNVMPPFEYSFVEMRFPSSSSLKVAYEAGGIFLVMQSPDAWKHAGHHYTEQSLELLEQPGIAYHLTGHLFLQARGTKPLHLGTFVTPVDKDGQIVPLQNGRVPFIVSIPFESESLALETRQQHVYAIVEALALPTFLALSFMHCRNVKMVEEIPPPKLSKKHEKKGNKPLVRYHVLKIDHMKVVLEREGHASTEGLKKALHICRGHFATYGKDGKGKLFGKHEGRFWFPDHLRGNPVHGVVDKAYDVR